MFDLPPGIVPLAADELSGVNSAAPRPWLRPAFDESKDKAVKVFGEKIWKKVKELAAKK